MLSYLNTEFSVKIIRAFKLKMAEAGRAIDDVGDSHIRKLLHEFLSDREFNRMYQELALEVAKSRGMNLSKAILQPKPTPRVFPPKAHGTSWNTDYLYGHGKKRLLFGHCCTG